MKGKDKLIKIIISIARILFGATFIFSGFVKAIDPLGFAYKIEDYLISFHLAQFIPLALTFAIVLILLEFLLGVFILLALYSKISTRLAVLFMVVMTPLTLYIAMANPVADCGCFGDALVISNWATFYKNTVLLSLSIFLYANRNNSNPFFTNKTKRFVVVFVFLFTLLFCLYNILYLPLIDFRPYKVGLNITEQMEDDLSKGDVYENIYVYEKDGVQREFTEDNFPWEDSEWTFIDFKSKLIKQGEKPLIDDFFITSYAIDSTEAFVKTGDITHEILSNPISLLVVSLSLGDANEEGMQQIIDLSHCAEEDSIAMHIVTSSDADTIDKWHNKLGKPNILYATMDELTLKTIVRSNPGLLLMSKGTIKAKWSSRNLPNSEELKRMIVQIKTDEKPISNNNYLARLLIICIIFVMPLLSMKWLDRRKIKHTTD